MNTISNLLHAASYSAQKHKDQRRKGENGEPYIDHPLDVANMLANIGDVTDVDILMAALLHDTIEDCGVSDVELRILFGDAVADYVLEVSDDKSLPKAERKRLQIEHAPHLSQGAKAIKLADKISNVKDVTDHPPSSWDIGRRRAYIEWACDVVAGLRGISKPLEDHFDSAIARAKHTLG